MAWCFLYRSVYTCLSAVQVKFAGKINHAASPSCAQRERTPTSLGIHLMYFWDFFLHFFTSLCNLNWFLNLTMIKCFPCSIFCSGWNEKCTSFRPFLTIIHTNIYIIQRKYVKCLRILVVIDGKKKSGKLLSAQVEHRVRYVRLQRQLLYTATCT